MRKLIVLGMVALMCAVGTAQTNLFTNGDFETGDWTGWTIKNLENGQTAIQTVEMYDIDGSGPLGDSLAGRLSVGQVNFQSGYWTGIEMLQELDLSSGTEYEFDADLSAFMNSSTYGNAQGGRFELIVGGQVLDTWDCGSLDPMQKKYAHVSGQYTPAADSVLDAGLRITRPYLPSSYLSQYVDNVTAVPEPTTFGLLALGALAALRRR